MKIIRVGRSSYNDVVIDNDLKVSGNHCQIIEDENGSYRLIDTNSTNGTFVNGVRLNGETRLNQSDTVRIGNTNLPWQTYFNGGGGGRGNYHNDRNIIINNIASRGDYPPQNKPDSFLVWSILCTILCCMPFGIVSIVYATQVDCFWSAKDYDSAAAAARKARIWFWWSFGIGLGSVIIVTLYYVIFGMALLAGFSHAFR